MSSSNRSHRQQSDRPSLKQRAAELEAGLARVARRPGATEAADPAFEVTAAYRAAWDALGAAIEAGGGEEAPEAEDACSAAYARLRAVRPTTPAGFQVLAETWAWRLRAERATPATGSDGTHTVGADAADSLIAGAGVCMPTVAPGGDDDAVHALIAEHRAAYTAWDRDARAYDAIVPGSAGYEAAGAAERVSGQRERAAYEALFVTRSTTLTGILALAEYLGEAVSKVTTHVGSTEGDRALSTITAALRGLEPSRVALADIGLTSEISKDVFAAIKDHRDVMAATAVLAEADEGFDRQGEMQNAAERAVAQAPVRSLADLRAKLTYLIPIIAPDMLDRTHVEHLQAMQADMDRLCRDRSRPADSHEDVELLRLGEQLDRAHARWRIAAWQYREPEARLKQALEDARARGGPTLPQLEAAWGLPGVREAHEAEHAAFGALSPICDAIWLIPAGTPAGLAVKARAALVHIWSCGQFEEDAALGEEEGLTEEASRRLIEACCTLAGVDWRGDPISPPLPDPTFSAIERHLAARAACVGLDDGVDEERYEAAHGQRRAALDAVEDTRPTTVAGLLALARHMQAYLTEDGEPPENSLSGNEHAFAGLIRACLGLYEARYPGMDRDWAAAAANHPGFLPVPQHQPACLLRLDYAIPQEAAHLLALAEAEFERRREAYAGFQDPTVWPRVAADLRRDMRMDALAAAAAPPRSSAPGVMNDVSGLVCDILDGWAAWSAAISRPEGDPEMDAAYERAAGRLDELLDAAEALPATLDSLVAKALAISWVEFVAEERPMVPRSRHSFTGRIAFDIHAAIMGRAARQAGR